MGYHQKGFKSREIDRLNERVKFLEAREECLVEDLIAARMETQQVAASRSSLYEILEKHPPPEGVKWR